MTTILLLIIYLSAISIGLPDSLLGAAWPVMRSDYGAQLETGGLLFMTISGGTIISSLASGRILKRLGTGTVTFVSILMTAVALLGFYFAPSVSWLVVCAIPLGLGAGAVDAGVNDYIANHYKARHMSWLHSFWGVGATFGPIILAQFISGQYSWRSGYLAISVIQFILAVILLISIPLWRIVAKKQYNLSEVDQETITDNHHQHENVKPLQINGVKLALISFMFYCGIEATMGLWGSSFLVEVKNIPAATAAGWVSLYWGGLTVGRFVVGFITFKISNLHLIRSGQLVALGGAALLLLPFPSVISLVGFMMIGLGLAPIFPCMLHETPKRFGKTHSQVIMGYQMAVAYTGSTFVPPLLGFVSSHSTLAIFPYCMVAFIAAMLLSSEKLNRSLNREFIKRKTFI